MMMIHKESGRSKKNVADFWQIWQFVVDEWWSWWLWRCWLVGQWPKGKIAKGENCQRGKLPYVYKKIFFSWRIGLASESCGWRMSPTGSTWRLSRCFHLFFLLLCFQCCPIDHPPGCWVQLCSCPVSDGGGNLAYQAKAILAHLFLNIIIMNMFTYHHLSHSHHLP